MNKPLVLDGRAAADALLKTIKSDVDVLRQKGLRPPGLLVLQVGENPASDAYIRQKKKAAEFCGFLFIHKKLSNKTSKEEILSEVQSSAEDSLIDGMIVQLPLDSAHSFTLEDVQEILEKIPPSKDADGLHSFNQGKLFTAESVPDRWSHPIPATPLGVYRLLEHYKISMHSRDVTIVGKSRLVGLPTAVLAAHAGATVTICNRLTKDLQSKTRHADIVIVAAGKRHLIRPEHLKEGAVVVDVGMHVKEDGRLTGDVAHECYAKTSAYSPVPGGVGPMTVASLIENTYRLRVLV